jgi:hypothetical protein
MIAMSSTHAGTRVLLFVGLCTPRSVTAASGVTDNRYHCLVEVALIMSHRWCVSGSQQILFLFS